MTLERHRAGPLALVGRDWPAFWLDHARDNYRPWAEGDDLGPGGSVTLRHAGVTSTKAIDSDPGLEIEMRVTRDGDTWFIDSDRNFDGRFDPVARTYDVWMPERKADPRSSLDNAVRGLANLLFPTEHRTLLFHAASGILDGHGLLFPGVSTAGKSTLSLGWTRTTYLSDDLSLVRVADPRDPADRPSLEPTPFYGITGHRGADLAAPLAAIALLQRERVDRPRVERLTGPAALTGVMERLVNFSRDPVLADVLFGLAVDLIARVPVFRAWRTLDMPSDDFAAWVLDEATRHPAPGSPA